MKKLHNLTKRQLEGCKRSTQTVPPQVMQNKILVMLKLSNPCSPHLSSLNSIDQLWIMMSTLTIRLKTGPTQLCSLKTKKINQRETVDRTFYLATTICPTYLTAHVGPIVSRNWLLQQACSTRFWVLALVLL